MKYSVVIPMFISAKTILDAINSVFEQTRFDLIDEIIVVDDGSTDNSVPIVLAKQATNDVLKLIKKGHVGAANARNTGIRIAKNDYIALLDSDDEWLPNKIEIQNKILEMYPEIKALGSNRTGEIINYGCHYSNDIRKISPFQYCLKNWPCTPSVIFDRKVFSDDMFFPEYMTHVEEGLFFLYLAHTCGLYYCKEDLVFCGKGKRSFGESGLSGDMKEMHNGVINLIKIAASKKYIYDIAVPMLILFENIKYLRRKIIVKNAICNKNQ